MTQETEFEWSERLMRELPNAIFVFGSNLAGIHGAGAAETAFYKYGAIVGCGKGIQGSSYALPTKDAKMRCVSKEFIRDGVIDFLVFADEHPELNFVVTAVGTGYAGHTIEDMASLFVAVPPNVHLCPSFIKAKESK